MEGFSGGYWCPVVLLPEKDKTHWFTANAGRSRIDSNDAYEMTWLLEKMLLTLPIFEPDFCFADVQSSVVKNMGDDPRPRAWPVMIYGSELVERHGGREKVLEAPVWRVDELSGGMLLIQVAENPFKATESQLKKVASYLGLAKP